MARNPAIEREAYVKTMASLYGPSGLDVFRALEQEAAALYPEPAAAPAAPTFTPESFDAKGAAHYLGETNAQRFLRLTKREPELQRPARLHGRTGLRWHKRDLDTYLARRHGVAASETENLADLI